MYQLPPMPLLQVDLEEGLASTKRGAELKLHSKFINTFMKYLMEDLLTFVDDESP
jgi:hypothetical protein